MKIPNFTKEKIIEILFRDGRADKTDYPKSSIEYIYLNYKKFIKEYPWRKPDDFSDLDDLTYLFDDILWYKKFKKLSPKQIASFNYQAFCEFYYSQWEFEDYIFERHFGKLENGFKRFKKLTLTQKKIIIDIFQQYKQLYGLDKYKEFLKDYGKIKSFNGYLDFDKLLKSISEKTGKTITTKTVKLQEIIDHIQEYGAEQYMKFECNGEEIDIYEPEEKEK